METKEIIEGNKLIAEFMQIQMYPPKNHTDAHFHAEELKYHSDWSWLMPVVEKIKSTLVEIGLDKKHILNLLITHYSIFVSIEDLYKAVIEFIKWYNTKKS